MGSVGGALAAQLLKLGKHVVLAARDPSSDKTRAALAETPGLTAVGMAEAVKAATMVFICCPYPAVADCIKGLDLNGKPYSTAPIQLDLASSMVAVVKAVAKLFKSFFPRPTS